MLPTRSRHPIQINRGIIAETGVLPPGYQLIQDTHAFTPLKLSKTVVESLVNGKKVEEPIMRVTGLFQEADIENANLRIYPYDTLAEATRVIQDDVAHRRVYGEFDHPCTCVHLWKVLTVNDGWKWFKDIKIGDKVWSRVDGKMVESTVNAITDEPYNGPAYRLRGRHIDASFTPGHRMMLVRRRDKNKNGTHYNIQGQFYTTMAEIAINRRHYQHHPIPRTASWSGRTDNKFVVKGYKGTHGPKSQDLVFDTIKFMGFLGLYLAEGYVANTYGVCVTQTSEPGRSVVREFLSNLHPDLSWSEQKAGFYINDSRLSDYLEPLGNKYTKYIPDGIKALDVPYLEELIHWFILGDGRMLKSSRGEKSTTCKYGDTQVSEARLTTGTYGRTALFSVSEKLVDDLHECLVKTGRCGRRSTIVTEDDYTYADHIIKAENKKPLHQLHISKMKDIYLDQRFTAIEEFHHVGRIYCLSVTHGNFYMEQNGCTFWTGNSDAKLHLDRISHGITKLWMDQKKIFGEAEIIDNQPFGRCLRGLFERKWQVGISSRGVGDMELREMREGKQYYEVMPGYSFVTWDAVAEPSVHGATLAVLESLQKKLKPVHKAARQGMFSKESYEAMLVEEISTFFQLKDHGPRRFKHS